MNNKQALKLNHDIRCMPLIPNSYKQIAIRKKSHDAEGKYFYLYKITCSHPNYNGYIYYGVKSILSKTKWDWYYGGGEILQRLQLEIGLKYFTKEIMSYYPDRKALMADERRIVTREFVARYDNFNVSLGGGGRGRTHSHEWKDIRIDYLRDKDAAEWHGLCVWQYRARLRADIAHTYANFDLTREQPKPRKIKKKVYNLGKRQVTPQNMPPFSDANRQEIIVFETSDQAHARWAKEFRPTVTIHYEPQNEPQMVKPVEKIKPKLQPKIKPKIKPKRQNRRFLTAIETRDLAKKEQVEFMRKHLLS